MIVKVLAAFLGLLNGGWMVFDGFHVLIKGKYFGPELGPWSAVVSSLGIDPLKIGPVSVIIGFIWLIFTAGELFNQNWAWLIGIVALIITLWYFPVGTFLSILIFILLIVFRKQFIM